MAWNKAGRGPERGSSSHELPGEATGDFVLLSDKLLILLAAFPGHSVLRIKGGLRRERAGL